MLEQTATESERYEARRMRLLDDNTRMKVARIQGEKTGVIQFCERLLRRPETPTEQLTQRSLEDITRLAIQLQDEVQRQRCAASAPNFAPDVEMPFSSFQLQMLPAVPMTQEQFFDFCQQNRKIRMERTAQGELLIMPPSGGETGAQNLSVSAQLYVWSRRDGTGKGFDSSTGFILPNGANRSADASWVSLARLAALSPEQLKKFLPFCPDFVVEILSPTDSLRKTIEKMAEYMANGACLGWLINPRNHQVHVYRPQQPAQLIESPKTLSGDPELPGFVLDLEPVWRP